MATIIKDSPRVIAKLEQQLQLAQGKATARTLDISDLFRASNLAEELLEEHSLPARLKPGATYYVGPEYMPCAYGHAAASTVILLTRRTTGWELTSVERKSVSSLFGARSRARVLTLSDAALEYRLERSIYKQLVDKKIDAANARGAASALSKLRVQTRLAADACDTKGASDAWAEIEYSI